MIMEKRPKKHRKKFDDSSILKHWHERRRMRKVKPIPKSQKKLKV